MIPEPGKRLSLSEIVLLRSLQVDLNQRTADLQQAVAGTQSLSDADQQAFTQLAAEQAALGAILESLTAPDEAEPNQEAPANPRTLDNDLDRALEEAGIPGFTNP